MGYNNVRIQDGDQWKAAFKTNKGLFEPTVMFFGMCNSPATFQAMMDDTFSDMIDEGIIIAYMDNIFLFTPDNAMLTKNTKRVLARLRENNLFLKPTKCNKCQQALHHDCLIRPQKHHLLQRSKKPESTTCTMVLIHFRIRCEIGSYSRTQDGAVRCTIPTTRSMP
jgi:hypothetical protein